MSPLKQRLPSTTSVQGRWKSDDLRAAPTDKWRKEIPGTRWFKADLHVHTIDDHPGGRAKMPAGLSGDPADPQTLSGYARRFPKALVKRGVQVVGLTPHSPRAGIGRRQFNRRADRSTAFAARGDRPRNERSLAHRRRMERWNRRRQRSVPGKGLCHIPRIRAVA